MTKQFQMRFLIFGILAGLFVFACIIRLFELQIINGSEYRELSERRFLSALPVKAPRGEMLDRYGRPLVSNRPGFFIQIQKTNISNNELHLVINTLINIMEEEDTEYPDIFPIYANPLRFEFNSDDEEQEQNRIVNWKKANNFDEEKTVDEIVEYYKKRYQIDEGYYSEEEIRDLIAVRYQMEDRNWGVTSPFTFASDVDMKIVQRIKESSMDLAGVTVEIEPIREYVNGPLASHILGRTGNIYKEEYEQLKDQNYGMNDIIGKDGMEKYLESYLRGQDGLKNVELTKNGEPSRVTETKHAMPGNYAVLTLDAHLQQVAESSLAKTIQEVRDRSRYERGGAGADAYCGAVVAVEINTGDILAIATMPTYDVTRFNEDYQQLYTDPLKPMLNRALNGTYEPGSTFKMATAIAGLESGVITPTTLIRDTGRYMRFAPGYMPYCMNRSGHGNINVVDAISVSCNYFFYETGYRTTIATMNQYSRLLGLGEATGIELSESIGYLAGPESKRKIVNEEWYPGDTIQAAIGQSYNVFTPAQLASYMATIANGGTRYSLRLLKEIRDYETNEVILMNEPQVLSSVDMSPENHQAVMEGMRRVAATGTAARIFANFEIPIGGKTGTSQSIGTDHGVFVGFAPFDDPQIAVAVVVEHGVHGSSISGCARDIFEAYFSTGENEDTLIEPRNQLLE